MTARSFVTVVAAAAICVVGTGRTAASTCAEPVGALPLPTAGNCLYDVVINSATGACSAGTGRDHPVTVAMRPITPVMGGRQSFVLGGGTYLAPFRNSISIRSWDSRNDYLFDTVGDVLPVDGSFTCVYALVMPPPVITEVVRSDGQVIGLEAHLDIDHDGDQLAGTVRIVAHGEGFEDSAVEVTTEVQNIGGVEARIGLRYLWATSMVGFSNIALGPVPPDPPTELWVSREGEWPTPAFDHLLASWTNAPSLYDPYYLAGASVTGPWSLAPLPTTPEVIVRGSDLSGSPPDARFGPGNTCFAWEAPDPPRGGPPTPGGGGNEALVYYWGRTEDAAIVLAPGESRSFTTWFWAFLENPVSCDAGGAVQVVECAGVPTPFVLDGGGSHTVEGNPLLYRWSSPSPRVTFDDPATVRPTAFLPGVGSYPVTLEVGIGPFVRTCETLVEVVDRTPPTLASFPADAPVPCEEVPPPEVPTISDACDAAPELEFAEIRRDGPCPESFMLERTWTVTDVMGNAASRVQRVTIVDETAPVPAALLVPSEPLPPRSARSTCSPPFSRLFRVACAASDTCDPTPEVAARLMTWWQDDGAAGCPTRMDALKVECGDLLELRVVAPREPCRVRSARAPGGALRVDLRGVSVIEGLRFVLEVTGSDRCGNVAVAVFDPAIVPSPLCDELLDDGTCCPALAGVQEAGPARTPATVQSTPQAAAPAGGRTRRSPPRRPLLVPAGRSPRRVPE